MHEWQTHGTCSGLGADAYFQEIRKVFQSVAIPAGFQQGQTPPAMLAPGVIVGEFVAANPHAPQGSFALSCGNNQLTAMEACFSKSLQPQGCESVRSCQANVVKIAAP